jgi:hypothetical protein
MPPVHTLLACLVVLAVVGVSCYVLTGVPIWLGVAGTLFIGLAWPT